MIYILHVKCFPIPHFSHGVSVPSRRVWISYDAFYPGKLYTAVQYKDVDSYSISLIKSYFIGTLALKVSQIL